MLRNNAIISTFFVLLTIFFSAAGYSSDTLEFTSLQVEHDFISNPKFNDEKIEIFILKPSDWCQAWHSGIRSLERIPECQA